jgi:hypothetical protein
MLNTDSLKEEKFAADAPYSFESVSIKRIHIYLAFVEIGKCHVHFCLVIMPYLDKLMTSGT